MFPYEYNNAKLNRREQRTESPPFLQFSPLDDHLAFM